MAPIAWAISNRTVETSTMIVEVAAMVGSMKSRRAANICLVSVVLTPPETKITIITSSNDVRSDSRAAVTTENLICGSVIWKNAFTLVAPRLRATHSWFRL